MKSIRHILVLAALLAPWSLQAAVPDRISYQGVVTDVTGNLVGNPDPVNRTVFFRIWSSPTATGAGDLIYSESQVVTISKGEFSVLLGGGAVVPGSQFGFTEHERDPGTVAITTAFNGAARYLGVTVDDGTAAVDVEISPRQQIVTTPFSLRAATADSVAAGGITSAAIADGAIITSKFANGSITSEKLVTGAVGGIHIADNSITASDIADGSVTASKLDQSTIGSWSLSGNNVYRSAGNVGINTANPTERLEVVGNIKAADIMSTGAYYTADGGALYLGNNNHGIKRNYSGANDVGVYTNNGDLYLSAQGPGVTNVVEVNRSGNVGIGKSDPEAKLHLKGSGFESDFPATSGTTQSAGQIVRLQGGGDASLDIGQAGGNGAWLQSTNKANLGLYYSLLLNPNGGNVGVGTASPASPLHVKASGSALPATSGTIQSAGHAARLQGNEAAVLDFGTNGGSGAWLQSTNSVALGSNLPLLLNPNGGDVSIGAHTGGRLTVQGDVRNAGIRIKGTQPGIQFDNTDGGNGWNVWSEDAGELRFYKHGGAELYALTLAASGNVGIGTVTPGVKLDVVGSTSITMNDVYGLDQGIQSFYAGDNSPTDEGASFTNPVSIRADEWIATAKGFVSYSDRRIKRDVAASETERDLKAIEKLRVTDYRMVDPANGGNTWRKGFIAQELEEVIPGAVSRSVEFIPDVFSQPNSVRYDAEQKTLALTLAEAHELKNGDVVRLHVDGKSRLDLTVSSVPSTQEFVVENCETEPGEVFVYGKQVKDFRTVDYDRIFTTAVGALQQLKTEKDLEVKTLQEENAALRASLAAQDKRLAALESRDKSRDAKLAAIEKMLSAGAPAVQPVSLKATVGVE